MKRLYHALLQIYPAGFREEYGSELERQFSDEYREAASRGERVRLGARALADLAMTAPTEIARELWQDVRYGARIYRNRWVASALSLIAMALAIGVTTGVFSVLNAVLIRSLPFREPEQLVELSRPLGPEAGREYLDDLARSMSEGANLGVGPGSFRVEVSSTTANFFRVLGVEPELGRGFAIDEDVKGRNQVAVIGYDLWQQAFGGDPRTVGSKIRLDEATLTVIGVAPRGFDFPAKSAVWIPSYGGAGRDWVTHNIGRLKRGITFDQAVVFYQLELNRLVAAQPQFASLAKRARLVHLQQQLAGPIREASLVLMGMMVFVLLIACASMAHLLLSRATERSDELAIRTALGASRARLTRQLITEAALLTGIAAVVGLAIAEWVAHLAAVTQPAQLPSQQYSVLDGRVVAFALGLAALTAIVFGVLPASLIGRRRPGPRGASANQSANRMRAVLIAGQAALTVTLAAGAYSMGRSFQKLMGIDLGFRTTNIVTLSATLPSTTMGRTAPFARDALERLRAIPGVLSAGAASYLPLAPSSIQEGALFRLDMKGPLDSALLMLASPEYFRTMGTPVIEGRDFTANDRQDAPWVVIVTEHFARLYPNRRLVGAKLFFETEGKWATIVGVVPAQRFAGPDADLWEAIYRPMDQYEEWSAIFVAKVQGDPQQYLAACRDAVQGVDPSVPVFDVKTLDQRLADVTARPRVYTTGIAFLAGFALLVAALGTYGAASHSVSQRRHEIGIRIAVGGPAGVVRGMIFRQSMLPVCAGVTLGTAGAASLGRFLKHLIASADSPGVWTCASAVIAIVAATACAVWIATSRVVRTDPTTALRME